MFKLVYSFITSHLPPILGTVYKLSSPLLSSHNRRMLPSIRCLFDRHSHHTSSSSPMKIFAFPANLYSHPIACSSGQPLQRFSVLVAMVKKQLSLDPALMHEDSEGLLRRIQQHASLDPSLIQPLLEALHKHEELQKRLPSSGQINYTRHYAALTQAALLHGDVEGVCAILQPLSPDALRSTLETLYMSCCTLPEQAQDISARLALCIKVLSYPFPHLTIVLLSLSFSSFFGPRL